MSASGAAARNWPSPIGTGRVTDRLADSGVLILRSPEEMPWGERIASVLDADGNPVALCAEKI